MRIIAAYLLAVLGGNDSPSEKDVKKILSSVGADADADRLALFFKEIEGKNIEEVIAEGEKKLASAPSGGGGGGAAAPAAAAAGGAAPAAKEEKKEEPEESSEEMGFGLFD